MKNNSNYNKKDNVDNNVTSQVGERVQKPGKKTMVFSHDIHELIDEGRTEFGNTTSKALRFHLLKHGYKKSLYRKILKEYDTHQVKEKEEKKFKKRMGRQMNRYIQELDTDEKLQLLSTLAEEVKAEKALTSRLEDMGLF
tara:strand:- start:270 stop:689 length:420 start_codon:yes stop_codon:yes gene_type:complete